MNRTIKKHIIKISCAVFFIIALVIALVFFTRNNHPTQIKPTTLTIALTPHTNSEKTVLQNANSSENPTKDTTQVATSIPSAEAQVLNLTS